MKYRYSVNGSLMPRQVSRVQVALSYQVWDYETRITAWVLKTVRATHRNPIVDLYK